MTELLDQTTFVAVQLGMNTHMELVSLSISIFVTGLCPIASFDTNVSEFVTSDMNKLQKYKYKFFCGGTTWKTSMARLVGL